MDTYEKKYKDALERAKECHVDGLALHQPVKDVLEYIFPELQESEDERILEIIKHCIESRYLHTSTIKGISQKQCFTWLEKQGNEPKVSYTTIVETGDGGINALVTRELPTDGCDDEQKPTDKVKPKFKIGEWITNGDYTWKIVEVKPLDYILQAQDGNIVDDTISHVDEQFHSFTVENAKDGDVLDANGAPFIYKRHDKDYVYFYCGINLEGEFIEANGIDTWNNNNKVYSATKEQRDLLFQKMKEAGYEWDAENKELNKIEDEEYNGEDYGIDSLYHAQRILEKTLGEVEGYQSDDGILDHKAAITAVKKLYKQKPWSVEDMSKVQRICKYLDEAKKYYADITEVRECTNWLKSLKDRVQPQSKQEWSEEDVYNSKLILSTVSQDQDLSLETKDKLTSWFKSLKPQNHWKPSDEQIKVCKEVYADILSAKGFDLGTVNGELNRLEAELKKLK